jgi:hypothetical protein
LPFEAANDQAAEHEQPDFLPLVHGDFLGFGCYRPLPAELEAA